MRESEKGLAVCSLAEFLTVKFPKPATYGWEIDAELLVIYYPPFNYEIDLEECLTSAAVLDWIIQLAEKTWCTPEVLTGLVNAFRIALDPQANLCSFHSHKTITRDQVAEIVRNGMQS